MDEIRFDESQLKNIQALGAALFAGDSTDPRSWNYERHLVRPAIRWPRILMFILLLAGGAYGAYRCLTAVSIPSHAVLWICLSGVLAVILLFLKRILICLVQIYQRYAPDSIRNKCRFEPSCSEYMILALEKYGLWKGLKKGINRLSRCNANDGGYDYP